MPVIPSRDTLQRTLSQELAPEVRAWLDAQRADTALLTDRTKLRVAFARAGRKLGADAERAASFAGAFATLPLVDLARAVLLLDALDALPESEHVERLSELYRTGEQREQQSVLRALPLLPEPARFVTIAIEACRTNSPLVFGAIANDSPFPADHFPELNFNQLVLKAIFLGVPVQRIVGLAQRTTPELRRMVSEYASERRAAGRPIPGDVDHVLALTSAS